MEVLYKYIDGYLEERHVPGIDLNAWLMQGWVREVPQQAEPIETTASRKRSTVNASNTMAA